MKIKLGDYNNLKIVKSVDFGLYLDGGDEGEILLPSRYVPENYKIGEELEVFIYLDQDERPVATTLHPLAKVGEFAWLEVAWVNEYGAFLNWGLMKDIFCPFREQKMRMMKGNHYLVYILVDEESYRIMATAKVDRYIQSLIPDDQDEEVQTNSNSQPIGTKKETEEEADGEENEAADVQPTTTPNYRHGDAVELLIWQKTDLGFKAIVDGKYQGLIYDDQVFQPLRSGDKVTGYIDHIRTDGKIDLTIQPTGRKQTEEFSEVLLNYLQENGGYCNLGDKSDSELIRDRFKVSKKVYKRAIGDLYKRQLIIIADDGIRLKK